VAGRFALVRRIRRAGICAVVVLGPVAGLAATPAAADASTGYAQIITLGGSGGGPSACQLARISLDSSGHITPIGPVFDEASDGCPFDMARHDGRLYGVLNNGDDTTPSTLVRIDTKTGARFPIASLGFATNLAGLAFDDRDRLWFYAQNADPACNGGAGQACLYRIDLDSGTATLVAVGAPDAQVLGATATCDHVLADLFLGGDEGPPASRLAVLDTSNGALAPRPDAYGGIFMTGLEHDPEETLFGLGIRFGESGPETPASYTINPVTGLATKLADLVLGPNQLLAALAIGDLACDVDTPAPIDAAPASAAPLASVIQFTG
jgi:hypothetical protein